MKLLGPSQLEGVRCDGVKGQHHLLMEDRRLRTYHRANNNSVMLNGVRVEEVVIIIYLHNNNNSYVFSMKLKWKVPKRRS